MTTTIRHGTTTAYAHHKCRCSECRAAVAEYNRKRQAAKRDGTWTPGRYIPEAKSCFVDGCDNRARYINPQPLCPGHYLQRLRGATFTPLVKKRFLRDGFKQCSRCERVLPQTDFNVQSRGRPQSACRSCASIAARAQRYGITFEEVVALLAKPCAGCDNPVDGKTAHIDHDHETGVVRGVLCHNCNTVLTWHMTPTILHRLAEYLEGANVDRDRNEGVGRVELARRQPSVAG